MFTGALSHEWELEVEPQLCRVGPRGDEVRSTEGGEEVIERHLIRDVDHGKAQTPLVTVAAEEVVVPDTDIKQMTRSDPRRIAIVILGSRRR